MLSVLYLCSLSLSSLKPHCLALVLFLRGMYMVHHVAILAGVSIEFAWKAVAFVWEVRDAGFCGALRVPRFGVSASKLVSLGVPVWGKCPEVSWLRGE